MRRLLSIVMLLAMCLPVAAATKTFPLLNPFANQTLPIQLLSTNPWGAYSVTRRLSSAYTGSLYRVSRSSDGAVQDIGFTSGNIADTNVLVAFTGTNTAYLRIVYDQTGNGHPLDQTSGNSNETPKMVINGAMQLDVMNRTTAYLNNNATNAIWASTAPATNAQGQHFFVCQPVTHDLSARRNLFCLGASEWTTPTSAISQNGVGTGFNSKFIFANGNPGTIIQANQYCPGNLYLLTAFFANPTGDSSLQIFTETPVTGAAGNAIVATPTIGGGSQGGDNNCADFKWSEWFLYTNQLSSADILKLQQNITNFYVFNPASCETNFSSLNTNLVAYWKMDETSGNRADSSGNVQTLTDNNTVTSTTGVITNSAVFTAANSEKLTRNDTFLSTGDIDFSFACWAKLTTKHALGTILGQWHTVGSELSYLLDYESSDDRFHFYVSANGSTDVHVTANNFGAPATNTWYHIVAGHDSVNNQIFIEVNDGTLDTLAHTTGVHTAGAGIPFVMGYLDNGGSLYYNGQIDEAGFWKKVLSSTERTQLYNSGAGKTCCPFTQ